MPDDVKTIAAAELDRSAGRIGRMLATLAGPPYTEAGTGVTRHAYTPAFLATLRVVADALEELGFSVAFDAIGSLVATNASAGEPCYGMGSHCDSIRGGGAYDGILGVCAAVEVARLAHESRRHLPLRIIAFAEEEAAGFGQMLLGSRLMSGRIDDAVLRTATDDRGQTVWDAAAAAGFEPARWRESPTHLEGLQAWIEVHIEQGRRLQDAGVRIGVVDAIAGYVHGDVTFRGVADHAGNTPMPNRRDALAGAASAIALLERLARTHAGDLVATVGEIEVSPGAINVIPGAARCSLDVRSRAQAHLELLDDFVGEVGREAGRRGLDVTYRERQQHPTVALDEELCRALEAVAEQVGVPALRMWSGAAHDTQSIAARVPSAMVFVPCRDGLSHTPDEHAEPADAALAAIVCLRTLERIAKRRPA